MSLRRQVKREIKAKLRYLGSNSDDVALTLRFEGVKGERGHAYSCPVANYLSHDDVRVKVSGNISVSYLDRDGDRDTFYLQAPRPIQNFIKRFDNGRYPEITTIPAHKQRWFPHFGKKK